MKRLLACLVVLAFAAPTASACDGDCGLGGGFGMGYLYNSLQYQVPYFAAHPPVYYSYPVPRTYGHSPFAYPPHFRTPEVVEPMGQVMSNPFVPSSNETPASSDESDREVSYPQVESTRPLTVENPYFVDDSIVSSR